ncbi:MAG: anti-sigma factor domain-containing protein [Candidatus Limnocylindrales bacterium]
MDHADVREVLEVAAAEPGGLDRLMAGDTTDAAAVAAHLAGCPDCTAELGRLRRTAAILRDVIPSEAPVELPGDLRERTLAYVRELGVPRPAVAAVGAADVIAFPVGERTLAPEAQPAPLVSTAQVASPAPVASTAMPDIGARRRSFVRPAVWVASIAAAVIISVVGTTMLFNSRAADEESSLQSVASWSIDIAAAPDAQHVSLSDPNGGAAAGTLSFSATDGGLAVIADSLAPASTGHEYRCWFETSAGRTKVGKMFFSGDIAYWVGDVEGLAKATPGTKFGVSLEETAGGGIGGEPVLIGTL